MARSSERRRTIRIATSGGLNVESVTPGPALRLLDVGMGGFGARSMTAMLLGAVASYRFVTPDRKWSAVLRAKPVHSLPEMLDGRPTGKFINGFSFVYVESAAVQQQLCELMDRAMGVVSFS
jgi:hypothetical protein